VIAPTTAQATSHWNTDILKQEDARLQFKLLTEKFESAVNSHEYTVHKPTMVIRKVPQFHIFLKTLQLKNGNR